ncbi:MAG TPA: hypothetical protein VKV04_24045 [Verrucomicrobiae bacterium]|nr:hypothetical protein [Verrucomicrobiae bacterium]
MKRQKLIFGMIALALITGTALLLAAVPQKLGPPGVKAHSVAGSDRWQIDLPETVLGLPSTNIDMDEKALEMLPKDTSYVGRVYYGSNLPPIISSVVMMGTDRTSIHKAEYCLSGQGMHIDSMTEDTIKMSEPQPYDLPVIKILASESVPNKDGKTINISCVYVYWYVTDGELSNDRSGFGRMWSMARQLVFTGVLQRWAYVRFFTYCNPGQEEAAYGLLKQMITASVPQFQLTPKPLNGTTSAQR